MSNLHPDKNVDIVDVMEWVHEVSNISGVSHIYLVGSRSAASTKQPRERSDWDFMVVADQRVTWSDRQEQFLRSMYPDQDFIRIPDPSKRNLGIDVVSVTERNDLELLYEREN